MKILNLRKLGFEKTMKLVEEARSKNLDVQSVVGPILRRVKDEGDVVVKDLCEKFDGVRLSELRVTKKEIDDAVW